MGSIFWAHLVEERLTLLYYTATRKKNRFLGVHIFKKKKKNTGKYKVIQNVVLPVFVQYHPIILMLFVCPVFTAQPAGVPEILKKSLHSCSIRGGEEVFIIGKNFLKDTKVIFHENVSGKKSICMFFGRLKFIHRQCGVFCLQLKRYISSPDEKSWKAEAEIDMELFHQVKCECFATFATND